MRLASGGAVVDGFSGEAFGASKAKAQLAAAPPGLLEAEEVRLLKSFTL
jgi:hypothetical protein